MSRILLDGRFVGVGESMTRYTLEVLRGILELDKENEYTLLIRPVGVKKINEWLNFDLSGLKSENTKIQMPNDKTEVESTRERMPNNSESGLSFDIRNLPACPAGRGFDIAVLDIPHYSLGEQTKLLNFLNEHDFDLVHFIQFNHPVRYKKPYVVTVHDLTMVGYLHRANPVKRLAFGKVMKSAVTDSKRIITVSETSKQEIVDYYKVNPDKIVVTYNGIDLVRYNPNIQTHPPDSGVNIKRFKEKHGIGGEYLLYTGMWKKHKNLKRLLEAFEKCQMSNVKCQKIQLVLVGKKDESEQEVVEGIERVNNQAMKQWNNEAIITTGYVEEEELPVAYAGALAYVIPSLSEGFGIPPLEAMACGTPVISSNLSCMPEILGDAAYYFNPYDVEDMARAIEKIVNDEQLREELTKKGLEQAKRYSWQETARKTLEVYKGVLEGR